MWITTAAQLAEKLPMTAEELAAVAGLDGDPGLVDERSCHETHLRCS